VYTDPRVIELIQATFVPVRVHVKENASEFKRLGERLNAQWTPTILVVDDKEQERHRIEGFLPADDFLAQLALGVAHAKFASGDFVEAARLFEDVLNTYPASDAAPEAQYWAGVSGYKATGDASALKDTARRFTERFQDTSWAKKASVWQ
jgi:TolA-binding protein